ncbi:predicted protein [Nematostella vectensis]|uniref:Uncharacterized protein n=1 Tax=Nematostella vectensis TaxID=45351 RepID=A8DUP4_NEMVE|nr:predicted protein [Nematostella vectensis]|eukprot:XP_001620877.1 hypothetical protein NEMVEDRAFT_v1g248749 [Nematostella vectensis]
MAEEIEMEVIEQVVEQAVEQAIEEAVEVQVEAAVEEMVEAAIEDQVENVVENAVEEVVEQEVEEVVEQEVEQGIEAAVEEAAENGFWRNILTTNILPAIIAGVVAGVSSGLILDNIHKAEESGNCEEKTKESMKAASKVLQVVNNITARWKERLEQYEKTSTGLGTFQYKGEAKDAGKTIGVLVTRMKTELEEAQNIATQSTANDSWDQNIDTFMWRTANACEDLLAVFTVKQTGDQLQHLDFPLDSDEAELKRVLDEQMPGYKEIIKAELQKHLDSAVSSIAKKKATTAVRALIKPPMTSQLKSSFNKDVKPDIVTSAKEAARAQTTVVMNHYMSDINKHAAIPVYGLATLKTWMEHHVAPTAKKEATQKALEAANAALQLPPAQVKIMKLSKDAREKVMREYNTKIKKAARDEVEKVIQEHVWKNGKPDNTKNLAYARRQQSSNSCLIL